VRNSVSRFITCIYRTELAIIYRRRRTVLTALLNTAIFFTVAVKRIVTVGILSHSITVTIRLADIVEGTRNTIVASTTYVDDG